MGGPCDNLRTGAQAHPKCLRAYPSSSGQANNTPPCTLKWLPIQPNLRAKMKRTIFPLVLLSFFVTIICLFFVYSKFMDIVVVEVVFPVEGKEEQLVTELNKLDPVSRPFSGCLAYDVFKPVGKTEGVMVYMRFDSEENLKKHEKSEYLSVFMKANDGITYSGFTYSKWAPFQSN